MALTANFDTPQSSSSRSVAVSGTVAAGSTAHVTILLDVTNTSASRPRSDAYYREVDFTNTTNTAASASGTYAIAIVPKVYGTDTVEVSDIYWSYE